MWIWMKRNKAIFVFWIFIFTAEQYLQKIKLVTENHINKNFYILVCSLSWKYVRSTWINTHMETKRRKIDLWQTLKSWVTYSGFVLLDFIHGLFTSSHHFTFLYLGCSLSCSVEVDSYFIILSRAPKSMQILCKFKLVCVTRNEDDDASAVVFIAFICWLFYCTKLLSTKIINAFFALLVGVDGNKFLFNRKCFARFFFC